MILVDAHVHIYDCFELDTFLDAAYSNFKSAADRLLGHVINDFTGILLLAEASNYNWFIRLKSYADDKEIENKTRAGNWIFYTTDETCSIRVRKGNSNNLFLIAGRQIQTSEGLELLALATPDGFKDGTPIGELLRKVIECNGIPVIPYGFGKWLGCRGRILKGLLNSANGSTFFLGDNSGRPWFLPRPSVFNLAEKKGIKVIPGSDPLPFQLETNRAGSFGFSLDEKISKTHPVNSLKKILRSGQLKIEPYGRLESPYRFFHNQIAMQIKKRSKS